MTSVTRLRTSVALTDAADTSRLSVSARLDAVLDSGGHVLLLDDRGWWSSGGWTHVTVEEMAETARVVVGPDEPAPGRSTEEEAALHWARLAGTLGRHGIGVDPAVLPTLPHDVVLDACVRRLLGSPSHPGHGHDRG